MFGKKKKSDQNTFKNEPKKTVDKKNSGSFKIKTPTLLKNIFLWFNNPKTKYILGWFLLGVTLFLILAFVSYFYSWKVDQDKLELWTALGVSEMEEFENPKNVAQNIAGTLGAKVAHFFIFELFGIASFFVPFLTFLLGVKWVFKKTLISINKSFKVSFYYTLLSSSLLALIFKGVELNPGGNVGIAINFWISNVIGIYGLVILQLILIIISIFIFFDVKLETVFSKLFTKSTNDNNESLENEIINESADESPKYKTVYPNEDSSENELDKENELNNENNDSGPDDFNEETINKDSMIDNDQDNNSTDHETQPKPSDLELEQNEEKSENEFDKIGFEVTEAVGDEVVDESEIRKSLEAEFDPTLELSNFKFPSIELLADHAVSNKKVSVEVLEEYKQKIETTLSNYNIKIDSIKASVGPTVTLYEIVPAAGVRISKIKNLEDDIALSLAALGIRIIAPIPGRGTVGIEVPNPEPDIVSMKNVIASKTFNETKMELPIAFGKTISNETFVFDLTKMPHLLMAGATGQGKSVGLNCILVSLLYKKHPSQLKFVLVDPKKVELTLFNKITKHYLAKLPDEEEAIITDTQKVVTTLNSLCVEMDNRYELLKEAQCRNLKEYNAKFKKRKLNPKKGHKYLPYIVLVIDEFADLIMTAGKEVEMPIARLAQLARAIGIHLIVATQRPSVNIITGTIKANFPARVAFRVTSKMDSRTILDANGADQLIGRGDMLFSTGNDLIRLQCAFVDTPEVEEICEFIGDQQGFSSAHELPEYTDDKSDSSFGDINAEDRDELFEDAAKVIVMHQQGSASLLQRKLKLGYNRAGRIIDQLEDAGIIGPFEGSKARQVLVPDEYALNQKLNGGNEQT